MNISSYSIPQIFLRLKTSVNTLFANRQHGIFIHPPPQVTGEMMETAKKISIVASNTCENAKKIDQTENAKKIEHKSHKESPRNETAKTMPFSFFLSFEMVKKILDFPDKCYETVKMIISSSDFHLNKTSMNETPKDISNFIVFETAQKSTLLK